MSSWLIILLSFGYLLILFGIAWWAENKVPGRFLKSPYTYALALAVYCTAWTYYGSVGRASVSGVDFLTIYLGPTIFAPAWYLIMKKIIRICKVQNITTLSDFIAARYGKSLYIGGLVAIMAVLGVVPYISIQLKAISESFEQLTASEAGILPVFGDTAFYLAGSLALFTILFGTRKIDSTEPQLGLVTAIAFESIFKLIAFLSVGIFTTYFVFDGFSDLFQSANEKGLIEDLMVFNTASQQADWFWLTLLSMLAILLLPRQFYMGVKENTDERHLDKAIWLFPLYLLIINIFVLPIAFGGKLILGMDVNADQYVIAIPTFLQQNGLAVFAYLGGFSAATGMIIVSTIALSMMVTNSLLVPALAIKKRKERPGETSLIKNVMIIRRVSIVAIVFMAYAYFRLVGEQYSLVSIGLISFVAVAQFAPSVIGGLYWKHANSKGAVAGLISGFVFWCFTLVTPTLSQAGIIPEHVLINGLFGIEFLRPQALFGLTGMGVVSHGFFWSIFINTLFFIGFSLSSEQTSKERNQAEVFVDIFKYSMVYESSIVWKGKAYLPDIKALLSSFLGQEKTDNIFKEFIAQQKIDDTSELADFRLVNFAEKQLGAAIGTSSAHIMMSSIVREEDISFEDVFEILQESQQILSMNKELQEKSIALQEASDRLNSMNRKLRKMDRQKDEFISTVTHEMRTPITSIRAFSELIHDNPDLSVEEQSQFLTTIISETERMERLISQVLDLERFESGKQRIQKEPVDLKEIISHAVQNLHQIIEDAQVDIRIDIQSDLPQVMGDKDRLLQVMLNLISNAIKFCDQKEGVIKVACYFIDGNIKVNVTDNGPGIDPAEKEMIFQSFYQSSDQNRKKPKGSGLGLTICRKIIEHLKGKIWVEETEEGETRFSFTLPAIVHKKSKKYGSEKENIDR